MRCAGCSRINPYDATVCIACGEALGTLCPACGGSAPAGAAFCPTCGRALAPGDRVAERGSGDWGERRPATVLFSDLSGYTELNEALDPEDVAAVRGQIKDAVSRVVASHG